ncbi:3-phosphoshikimate 1-carboxyvinyltransferase [Yunchengibacter salinarum]|uniref:3-phosphoshikimate 1-carboxyvinyltransferase n=1 Tax=Yunchengibacter salinarum TaxID=3133399 RepID=UPI0035B603C0
MSRPLSSNSAGLKGTARIPGDKSISHRAVMLSSLAVGESRITGLLEGEDVMATANAMRALGADVRRGDDGTWRIAGVGVGGLVTPEDVLDMGNSGTSTRLIMGLLASHPVQAVITGDASLRKRPMDRVIVPLSGTGARITARDGNLLPLMVEGTATPAPLDVTPPMASAQVKSAVLLAGLNAMGETVVRENVATRDHTERMLSAMGARLVSESDGTGGRVIRLAGMAGPGATPLAPLHMAVPGDISSAAFPMVAASILPGSDIVIANVGLNPLRDGIVHALKAMGADITLDGQRTLGGETVADIRVRHAALEGIGDLPVDPSTLIDEFPVLFAAAAVARGTSHFTGLGELRVKESDRLAAMADGLKAVGVKVEEGRDSLTIEGCDGPVPGDWTIQAQMDHRIAMAFAVLGQRSQKGITIDDATPIRTSFPDFEGLMTGLGADLS